MGSRLTAEGRTVVGFRRVDPPPVRAYGEYVTGPAAPVKSSAPGCLVALLAVTGVFFLSYGLSEQPFFVLVGAAMIGGGLWLMISPSTKYQRDLARAQQQSEEIARDYHVRRQAWDPVESDRFRSTHRLEPVHLETRGLLTVHGGRSDSYRSFGLLCLGQWLATGQDVVVLDADTGLGPSVVDFARVAFDPQQARVLGFDTKELLSSAVSGNGSGFFDLESPSGRENILRVLFGYEEGAGPNRLDADFASLDAVLRVVGDALRSRPGGDVSVAELADALAFLLDRSTESEILDDAQRRALEGTARRLDDAVVRRLLDHVEPLEQAMSLPRGAATKVPDFSAPSPMGRAAVYSGSSDEHSYRRGIEQRVFSEVLLGLLTSLPAHVHVIAVLSDFDDHASPFLRRLETAAARRTAATVVCFPRFSGLVGEWATRIDQRGPLLFSLRDPDDAQRAARYLGEDKRMVLSQTSRTRGTTLDANWSATEGSNWGRSFGAGGGRSEGGSRGRTEGGGFSQQDSTTETYARSDEFFVRPYELQRLGDTAAALVAADGVAQAIDTFPPLWGIAEAGFEAEEAFARRYGLTVREMAALPPQAAGAHALLSRGLPPGTGR